MHTTKIVNRATLKLEYLILSLTIVTLVLHFKCRFAAEKVSKERNL